MAVIWVVDLGSLRLIRKRKSIKQGFLAEKVNMKSNNYSAIECGRVKMSLKTLCKICTVLDISPSRLLHPIYGKDVEDYEEEWRDPFL